MPSFRTTEVMPYTPQQMFDLVADVAAYPEFLPLCEALRIRERRTTAGGLPQLVADMTCGYKAIRETFTSRVTLDVEKHEILVEYVDGPFRHLHNLWRFEPSQPAAAERAATGGAFVHFDIDYAFKSALLGILVGAMFDHAFRRFVAAFRARADDIYGSSQDGSWPGRPATA